MKDATKLSELSTAIEDAVVAQDFPLAHRLIDERLLFLQSLCAMGQFDSELVLAAKSALTLNEALSVTLESEMRDLQRRLRDLVTADKAMQLYKTNSK